MNKIKIMVLNSQPSLRTKIRQALNELNNLEIIDCDPGEAVDNAVAQVAVNAPNIVILDSGFPRLKGLEFVDKITRAYSAVAVIVLSSNPEEDDKELFEAIRCGAVGYLGERQFHSSALLSTIKEVCEGKSPISEVVINRPSVAHRILRQFQDMALSDKKEQDILIPLTIEEERILELIVLENPRRQIAVTLSITENAIDNRLSNILKKLAANSRAFYLFNKMRNDLLSVHIAKYGNLFIFNSTKPSCAFPPSLDNLRPV